jgi:hypothetical protein
MAAFQKFNAFSGAAAQKKHNLNADSLKIMLTNTAPDFVNNAVKADLTDIAAGNGYAAGGSVAAFVSGVDTAGLYKLILAPVQFTAAGGNIGPFRYAVLYNDTATNKDLIGGWDYGVAITLTNGNSFTVNLDQVNGTLTLA